MSDLKVKKTSTQLIWRVFLAAAAGAVILTVLAGCPARTPPPTPTPTRTPRSLDPTGTATPPATATASLTATLLTPEPSATVTTAAPSTPTASPEPTATPTPPATPFPPGPASKLGLFVSRNDPRVFDLLRTGNVAVVKTVEYDPNFVSEIKQISPRTLLVGRVDLPQLDLGSLTDPVGAARLGVERVDHHVVRQRCRGRHAQQLHGAVRQVPLRCRRAIRPGR